MRISSVAHFFYLPVHYVLVDVDLDKDCRNHAVD